MGELPNFDVQLLRQPLPDLVLYSFHFSADERPGATVSMHAETKGMKVSTSPSSGM